VKQNEGFIDVQSVIDEGTTFSILLAKSEILDNEIIEDTTVDNREIEASGQTEETILLVEDEDQIREFVSSILEESGYTVLEAASGLKGLTISQNYKGKIDLLLSDIRMPKMTGPELAVELMKKHPETKILFISGHSENEELKKQIGNTKCGFLQKPFSYEQLLAKIRIHLTD
jgi:DNA-binding NtrC family response regulator